MYHENLKKVADAMQWIFFNFQREIR